MPIYGTENLQALTPSRGSGIQTPDTYVRPAAPTEDDGLNQLAKSLQKLGVNFADAGAEKAAKDEAEAAKNIEFYKAKWRTEFKDGVPNEVQMGKIAPETSTIIHSRVMESLGDDNAKAAALALNEELLQDEQLRLDPVRFNAALDAKMAEKEKELVAGGNVPYGSGFLKTFRGEVDRYKAIGQNERSKWYEVKQKEAYVKQNQRDIAAAKGNAQVSWKTADLTQLPALRAANVKDEDHVAGLNSEFATRLNAAIADAPPGIRERLKIASGYRSTQRQAAIFQDAVTKYGSEAAARKWAAPPGKSNHNHGEAVDMVGFRNFGNTPEGKWLHANAEKYGLYFPMEHEPWHVEMIGGRRMGGHGPETKPDLNEVDGEHDDDPIAEYMDSVIATESSGNPYAQSKTSSAAGLAGYTDEKWLEVARKHGGIKVASLTTDGLLGLRSNPEFSREMLRKDTEDNAERLRKAGMPVTKGNLYIMHMAGIGDAPKIIAASDSAPLSQVMQAKSIAANPNIAGMTVGQYKEWAAAKAGGFTPGNRLVHNAVRRVDQEWKDSGGLGNLARRDALFADIKGRAEATLDPSILDEMPPELVTPKIAADFAESRRKIKASLDTLAQKDIAQKEYERKERVRATTEEILGKLARKEEIDITDPRIHESPELFTMVKKAIEDEYRTDPIQSQLKVYQTGTIIDDAVASKDWRQILGDDWPIGKQPTIHEITQAIANTRGMTGKDKLELIKNLPERMNRMAMAVGPEAEGYFKANMDESLKNAQSTLTAKLAKKMGTAPNVSLAARRVYDASLRLSYSEGVLVGDAKTKAYEKAITAAQAEVDRIMKGGSVEGQGDAAPGGEAAKPEPTKAEPAKPSSTKAVPKFETGPDGVRRPVQEPQATQQPQPAPAASKPAPKPSKRVDPLEVEGPPIPTAAEQRRAAQQTWGDKPEPKPQAEPTPQEKDDAEMAANVQKTIARAIEEEKKKGHGNQKYISGNEDIQSFIDTVAEPFKQFFDPSYGTHARHRAKIEGYLKSDPKWLELRKAHLEGKDGATEALDTYERKFVEETLKQLNASGM